MTGGFSMKKITVFSLITVLLLTCLMTAGASEVFPAGGLIEFGKYPQTHITDETLIFGLEALLDDDGWQSLRYYCGDGTYGSMAPSDFAKYQDVEYNGSKYRAVTFSAYRPLYSRNPCGGTEYIGSFYGYETNSVHWFSYDPIVWKVLDAETGLLCCADILDSRALNDVIAVCDTSGAEPVYYRDAEKKYYANNYAESTLRSWLNGEFFSGAFSDAEKACIGVTEVDNSYDAFGGTEYICENTFDRIFIPGAPELSVDEYFPDNASLMRKATDYAKAAGIAVYSVSEVKEYDFWFLRTSAGSSNKGTYIQEEGIYSAGCDSDGCDFGIVPMLCVDLAAVKALQEVPEEPSPYSGLTFDFADGILMIGGSGSLPDPSSEKERPLEAYADTAAVVMLGDGVSSVAENAFAGFNGVQMLIVNGDTEFGTGALADMSSLRSVICMGTPVFDADAFSPAAEADIYEIGAAEAVGAFPEGVVRHTCTFEDGTLRVSGSVAPDYYTFLDIISVFCSEYDDIEVVTFDGFTSGDIYFRHINATTGKEEIIHGETLSNAAFRVSVSTENGEEYISFNELCRRAGDGSLKEFHLTVISDEYEDMEENIIQLLEKRLLRALKWVVGLLNAIFNLFTRLLS